MLTSFAADLRLLRKKAGSLTYRDLAARAHYSSTTLADAASGKRLPSLPVTLAYVRVCGGDPIEWETRWRAVVTELAEADQPPRPAPDSPQCPYVGLAAFQPVDAGRFFGREELTDDLVTRLGAGRFLAVFGASGSGKSSLLRAGLLPRMTPDAPVLLFTPGPHPLEECAVRLATLVASTMANRTSNPMPAAGDNPTINSSAAALYAQLRVRPRALHLAVLQAMAGERDDRDLLLVVDQFEEVFTLCPSRAERGQFITALLTAAQAANSRCRVVLGVRADFYPACSDYPDLVDALRDAQLLVGPMSTDGLRRAISLPAARAGCAVDSGLLARVVADATGAAGVLPLVSHALRETWQRRRGNTLTLAGYEATGGIQHALAKTAETVYSELTVEQQHLARGIFLRLVALGEGTEDTKRRVNRTELDTGHQTHTVLDVLAQARLVTVDTHSVEITHEALLQAWPRLRGWISADRTGLLIGQQLGNAATAWHREDRDPAALYRGSRLSTAREWLAEHPGDVRPDSRIAEFVAASVRQEHRAVRWRRAAVATLCALTLLASTAAILATRSRSTALAERDRAVSEQVMAEADEAGNTDPSLAAELDLAAYRIRPAQRAATNLLGTQNTVLSTPLLGHTAPVYAVAYSPDGRTLATGAGSDAGDNTIRLWDITDPSHPTALGPPLLGHTDWVFWLQFSPDGRTLASASRDDTARLWDVSDPRHPKRLGPPLVGHTSYVFSVAFSRDGRTLATASYDHTVRLWDVSDPAHAKALGPPLVGHTESVASAAYSPDGRTVASAGHDRTVRLWNVTDPAHPAPWGPPITGHSDTVYAVAFSPDSRTLASVSNDRTVRLWNVADPAHPVPLGAPLTGHTNTILAVAFSHDGRLLATGGADHTVRLWDVSDPAHAAALGPPLLGHTGIVNWVAFGPDDHTLASVSDDHTGRLWTLPSTVLTGHTGIVNAIAYSPDGATLASAGDDHSVRLWNVRDPAHPSQWGALTGHTAAVTRVVWNPSDGDTVASAGTDRTVRLWDVRDPAHPRAWGPPLVTGTDEAQALAFSPDGHLLATDGPNHTVRLWDVTEPARPIPLPTPLTGQISQVHWVGFSPDSHTVGSASADPKLRLWDIRDPAHPRALPPILTGDTDGLNWGAFSPNGAVLATAGSGHTVQLWDVTDPAHHAPLGQPLIGHTDAVYWVGFSPDGDTLASASADQTVRLWNTAEPAHAGPAGDPLTAGHTGAIDSAAYSPDGKTLASAGADGAIELTATAIDEAIDRICATTTNTLTPEQWHRYIPELPVNLPC